MDLKDICYCARKQMQLSQKAFAELVGTNQTAISFIERGFIPPPIIADAIKKVYERAKQ